MTFVDFTLARFPQRRYAHRVLSVTPEMSLSSSHQRRAAIFLLLAALYSAMALAGCANAGPDKAPAVTRLEPPGSEQSPAAADESHAIMPDVVCLNLQEAQDVIQEAGVFFSRSFDATGKGRRQIIDSNWVVVSQEPQPGSSIGEGDAKLGAVKYGEDRSC